MVRMLASCLILDLWSRCRSSFVTIPCTIILRQDRYIYVVGTRIAFSLHQERFISRHERPTVAPAPSLRDRSVEQGYYASSTAIDGPRLQLPCFDVSRRSVAHFSVSFAVDKLCAYGACMFYHHDRQ